MRRGSVLHTGNSSSSTFMIKGILFPPTAPRGRKENKRLTIKNVDVCINVQEMPDSDRIIKDFSQTIPAPRGSGTKKEWGVSVKDERHYSVEENYFAWRPPGRDSFEPGEECNT